MEVVRRRLSRRTERTLVFTLEVKTNSRAYGFRCPGVLLSFGPPVRIVYEINYPTTKSLPKSKFDVWDKIFI